MSSDGALNQFRILDLTRVWAGPLGTRALGDLGADVIKISDPRIPLDSSARVNNKLNRNKRNIGLRLDTEEGKHIFLELVSLSDAVIENFRPRVMRNLNLTYETLRSVNPTILMYSMPGFGIKGPYAEYPAFGSTAEAVAGIVSMIGYDSDRPLQTGLSYADPISGLNLVWSVVSYARRRAHKGIGCHIEVPLSESPLGVVGEYITASSQGVSMPQINGNKSQYFCPHGAYQAHGKDKWVALSVTSDTEWVSLKSVILDKELENVDYDDFAMRKSAEKKIDTIIANWTLSRNPDDIVELFQKAGVPAGTVANNLELLTNHHLQKRDYFVELEEKRWGVQKYDGQSIDGNQKPKDKWHAMHEVGEDNYPILRELLGFTQSQYELLSSKGIVGTE